jgi:hypothetical protein
VIDQFLGENLMKISSFLLLVALLLTSSVSAQQPRKPASSDLPPSVPQLPMNGNFSGGGASASSSSSSSGIGSNGNLQNQNKSSASAQLGNLLPLMPQQPSQNKRVSSDPDSPISSDAPAMQRRVVAKASSSSNAGDQIITGADDEMSTVIKIKANGQITMILVNLNTLDVRRIQAANEADLAKKDRNAAALFTKYTAAE